MNPEILKNQVRDRLIDILIVGGNIVRWAIQSEPHPSMFPDLHESEGQHE